MSTTGVESKISAYIKPAVQRVQSGKNREHNAGERCINPQ